MQIRVKSFLISSCSHSSFSKNVSDLPLGRVDSADEFFDDDDGDIFGAVSAGDQEDWAGLGAIDDNDGNVVAASTPAGTSR
jgi:hypothetical protein